MDAHSEESLRFGVICDGKTLQRWQAQSVRKLLKPGTARLALVIVVPESRPRKDGAVWSQLFFRLYNILFFKPSASKPVDMTDLFPHVPRLNSTIMKGKLSVEFNSRDLDEIRSHNLDFILWFGQGRLQGEILNAARYGVWVFQHSDDNKYGGGPSCFWEIFYSDPITGGSLQRITEKPDAAVVLKKGYFRTKNSSYAGNFPLACSESARWPAQVCIDIRNNAAQYLDAPPSVTKAGVFRWPGNLEMILFFLRLARNRLKGFYHLLFRYSVWNIGVVKEPIEKFLTPGYKPSVDWFPVSRRGEFKADPFGLARPPNLEVLFENLDYRRPKGIIYAVETLQAAYVSRPRAIIELPVHMSYPFLLEYKGETYCIPETNRAREISVYRALRFPYEWEKTGTLLKGVAAIDSTVFEYKERWWLMFTDRERGGDANLYVWHAPDFWGPWQPHANNPVKSDVRSTRPGGTPFFHGGSLYRPTQDCSRTGGGGIVLNRVTRLDETGFEEDLVLTLEPDRNGPYPEGFHTLTKAGDYTLVDGKRFEFLAVALFNNIVKGVRGALGLDS